jgi:hypothetical protein
MDSAKMTDQALRSAIEEHFVPWLASSVQAGEQTVGAKTGDPASLVALTQELERQRQNLRMTPLPSTPGAPRPSTPSKSSRKRAS